MNDRLYKYILYIISLVILVTIGIQLYWNYNNYQSNKQQLIRDVQTSLDKAVDDYYASLAKETSITYSSSDNFPQHLLANDSLFTAHIETLGAKHDSINLFEFENIEGLRVIRGTMADSLEINFAEDSLDYKSLELLTSKIFITLKNDSLDVRKVNKLLYEDLQRKKLDLDHHLSYYHNVPSSFFAQNSIHKPELDFNKNYNIYIESKSEFLPENSYLKLGFANETKTILKRSINGILISTILILAVISSLFYLLRVIKRQKQLSEVKNDLISNITHEFKTPIATIGVALESISNFNGINDKEKTKKYLSMSGEQLSKLNTMVEKLLETATLDSNNLELKKEPTNIIELLTTLIFRYKTQYPTKQFTANINVKDRIVNIDVFHFENALNNILDNAVKYGGDHISIDLSLKERSFEISISDNGNNLTKENKERIFEKFYRVPKGNTHDVKGFGIGLYYTKTIIEKHKGNISIDLSNQLTTFKITLPNG